jgi:hypothetical protein
MDVAVQAPVVAALVVIEGELARLDFDGDRPRCS